MEEIDGKREVRSDLMTVADTCDLIEEKHSVKSMVSIDVVPGEPPDRRLVRNVKQEDM